ncbi:MAG: preprotein translocase subunit YajC [Planctomycetes bacterium]|nr:preprotein translocase subunit YajC [Planctomycetota bacterium]
MFQALILVQDPPAPPASKPTGQGGDLFGMLPLLLIMFAIIYFLLIRPQSKERKRHQEMLGSLKKNDQVVTQGGIFGSIASIEADGTAVTLKIADNVRIKVSRAAIARKIASGEE